MVQNQTGRVRNVLLIVEDEALAELLDEALVDAGHSVVVLRVENPTYERIAEEPFDVVVIDFDARSQDMKRLPALLRAQNASIAIVGLCSYEASSAIRALCDRIVEKPARLAKILSAVDADCTSLPH